MGLGFDLDQTTDLVGLSALRCENRMDPSVHGDAPECVCAYMCTRGSLTGQSALLIQSTMYEQTAYQKFMEKHSEALPMLK